MMGLTGHVLAFAPGGARFVLLGVASPAFCCRVPSAPHHLHPPTPPKSNMGAKNHGVIMPDANKEYTINKLNGAAFGAAGQR